MNMESNLALNCSGIVSTGPWSTSKNRYMSDAKGTDLHSKLSSWSILWRRVGTLPRQLQTSKALARSQSLQPVSTIVSVYKCRLGWTRAVGAQLRYTVAHIPVVGTGRTNSLSKLSACELLLWKCDWNHTTFLCSVSPADLYFQSPDGTELPIAVGTHFS